MKLTKLMTILTCLTLVGCSEKELNSGTELSSDVNVKPIEGVLTTGDSSVEGGSTTEGSLATENINTPDISSEEDRVESMETEEENIVLEVGVDLPEGRYITHIDEAKLEAAAESVESHAEAVVKIALGKDQVPIYFYPDEFGSIVNLESGDLVDLNYVRLFDLTDELAKELTNGVFRVGSDIEAGTYLLQASELFADAQTTGYSIYLKEVDSYTLIEERSLAEIGSMEDIAVELSEGMVLILKNVVLTQL